MESEEELVRDLNQLRIKKEAVNADVDLTRECNSIIELDNRLSLLLSQVRLLRQSTEEQNLFVGSVCDKLEPNYSELEASIHQFHLCSRLQKLTRLCKQINTNPIFGQLDAAWSSTTDETIESSDAKPTPSSVDVKLASSCKYSSSNKQEEDGAESLGRPRSQLMDSLVMEFVDEFEATYRPLECLLNARPDLPYAASAHKLRSLKTSLDKRRPSTNGGSCD